MKLSLAQLQRFVGNPNAYSVQSEDGSWHPTRSPLDHAVLTEHLRQERTIGTYIGHVTDEGTVARTLCFDIDQPDNAVANEDAFRICEALTDFGFPDWSFGTEDSGRRGRHVWVVLSEYRPNAELRRMGRAILALSGVACEIYPKQDDVKDLGNLVKLPGGLHRVSKRPNDFLDRIPRPLPTAMWAEIVASLPPEVSARRVFSDSRFPCMSAIMDEGVAEGGRNNQLFHLAVMLRRAGVTAEFVDVVVRKVNNRCDPPLDDVELEAVLDSAETSGPICHQLPEDRQCGELCVLARTAGLYTRPGQLRHAAEGENVVVTVASRVGPVVELEHDDTTRMKGMLRGD